MQAWNRIVDQYSRLIWSITREFKLVESDAADVVQTTWMRLLEHIGRMQYPERVGSWLTVTARNECLRHLASHKRLVLVHEDVAFDDPPSTNPGSTRRCLPRRAPRPFARPWRTCRGGGNG